MKSKQTGNINFNYTIAIMKKLTECKNYVFCFSRNTTFSFETTVRGFFARLKNEIYVLLKQDVHISRVTASWKTSWKQ